MGICQKKKTCNEGVTEEPKVIAIFYILKCVSLARRQKCPFRLFARKLYCDNQYYRDFHQSSWMQKTPVERWSGIGRQFSRRERLGNFVIWTAVCGSLVLHVRGWLSDEGTLHIPQTVVFKSQSPLMFVPDSPSKILLHVCFCKHECNMVNESSPHLDLVTKQLPNTSTAT